MVEKGNVEGTRERWADRAAEGFRVGERVIENIRENYILL